MGSDGETQSRRGSAVQRTKHWSQETWALTPARQPASWVPLGG